MPPRAQNIDSLDQSIQEENQKSPDAGQLEQSGEINIGKTANIDDAGTDFPAANVGYTMDSSTPSPTSPPEKLTWKERIVEELKEIGLVIAYLATSFSIIQTFRCATILAKCSENDFLTSYATACVSALLLGKFVFVIEKMPISRRFENKPLIYAVTYKTILFTVLANVLMHAEARFLHHNSSSAAENPVPAMSDPVAFWLCAFAHQLAILVTFLIFFVFRDIARVVGRDRLHRMFFVSIK